ncbi:hypothetical protein UPYG_G00070530 [Umbra pygmaea]|uniref:Uncharacterized protein n=1 Tax=Umbra pygmaea TaxID=75934 RepID=A0ABD0XBH3_UMBPY
MQPITGRKLMTLQVEASLDTSTTAGDSKEGSGCTAKQFGKGSYYGAFALNHFPGFTIPGGRHAGGRPIHVHTSRIKYQRIQNNSRDGKDSSCDLERGVSPSSPSRLGSDNNMDADKYLCGRQFLFDSKWRNDNRMYNQYDFKDGRVMKPSTSILPLLRDRYTHHTELFHAPIRPYAFGSFEGYDLMSVPAVLLPAPASIIGLHPLVIKGYKERSRTVHQPCNLFKTAAHQKSQSYPDPVGGSPPPAFMHRLSELSYLEGDTIRQEKIRKMKKTKRQDT